MGKRTTFVVREVYEPDMAAMVKALQIVLISGQAKGGSDHAQAAGMERDACVHRDSRTGTGGTTGGHRPDNGTAEEGGGAE